MIDIERKGCRRVSQVALDRFDIVTVLQRQDRIGMSEVMHSCVRRTNGNGELLEVIVDRLRMKMPAKLIGKH